MSFGVSPTSALSLFLSPDTVGLSEAGAARRLGFPCRAAPPALSGGSILAHPSPLLRLKLFVAPHLVASRLDVVVDDPFAVPRRRISSLLCSLSVVVARRRRAFSVGGLPVSGLSRPCVGPSWCLLCCNSSFSCRPLIVCSFPVFQESTVLPCWLPGFSAAPSTARCPVFAVRVVFSRMLCL